MTAARRIVTGASLIGLAATGLVGLSTPAQASGKLHCDSGPTINCYLLNTDTASNEHWTVNNYPYSPGDFQTEIYYGCTVGRLYHVTITYIDAGGSTSASANAQCLSYYP